VARVCLTEVGCICSNGVFDRGWV